MRDAYGEEVVKNDLVYYRWNRMESFFRIGRVSSVRGNIGLFVIYTFDDQQQTMSKSPLNIKKLTDEEAMLWKLEND